MWRKYYPCISLNPFVAITQQREVFVATRKSLKKLHFKFHKCDSKVITFESCSEVQTEPFYILFQSGGSLAFSHIVAHIAHTLRLHFPHHDPEASPSCSRGRYQPSYPWLNLSRNITEFTLFDTILWLLHIVKVQKLYMLRRKSTYGSRAYRNVLSVFCLGSGINCGPWCYEIVSEFRVNSEVIFATTATFGYKILYQMWRFSLEAIIADLSGWNSIWFRGG